MQFHDYVPAVRSLAEQAGQKILDMYGENVGVDKKDDGTPVTEADYASNEIITDGLEGMAPFPILSEEAFDDERLGHDTVWVVDPLDGTSHFIDKRGDFRVFIGLAHQGEPVLGVVHVPLFNQTFYAARGHGAYEIHHGVEKELVLPRRDSFRVVVGDDTGSLQDAIRERIDDVVFSTQDFASFYLADGLFDAKITDWPGGGEWDVCAPHAIIAELGGTVTHLDGSPFRYNRDDPHITDGTVKSDGRYHDALIEALEHR
jgi:3'(2'), 5'-bisphosphate nucleotidase